MFSRSGSAPPNSGGRAERAPAPSAVPVPEVRRSPVLEELLAGLDPERGLRVLDLGPASRRNLECYSTFAAGIRFAGLWSAAIHREDPASGDAVFRDRLDALLPLGGPAFDRLLTWDLLNYLSGDRTILVVRRLTALAAPDARLHAIIATGATLSAEPLRYHIVRPGEVEYAAATSDLVSAPDLTPAEVERRLEPFRVAHSVVLRHGVRELVAVVS